MSQEKISPDLVRALQSKVKQLEKRVEELETEKNGSGGNESDGWGDHRDRAVIDTLTVGESYGPRDLISRYKAETDVRTKGTLKRRAKDLHRSPLFDRGTFVGDGGE